jgi:hypothetical protein
MVFESLHIIGTTKSSAHNKNTECPKICIPTLYAYNPHINRFSVIVFCVLSKKSSECLSRAPNFKLVSPTPLYLSHIPRLPVALKLNLYLSKVNCGNAILAYFPKMKVRLSNHRYFCVYLCLCPH